MVYIFDVHVLPMKVFRRKKILFVLSSRILQIEIRFLSFTLDTTINTIDRDLVDKFVNLLVGFQHCLTIFFWMKHAVSPGNIIYK